MNYIYRIAAATCVALFTISLNLNAAVAQFAAQVISYNAGSNAASGFNVASAAIGSPERFTNDAFFPSVVSPFSPPFLTNQIVSLGEGGQITLQLSNYAIPQAGGLPELGIFGNVGLVDTDYPNGLTGNPVSTFGDIESAKVEVSPDGVGWISLGVQAIDIPTNGYTDVSSPFAAAPGTALSDFQQPFVGALSSFAGEHYSPDMINLLAGSGGGKWLDISGTGLAQVGFVRFSIADDGNASTKLKFELDAVSVSHAALGTAVVPEPTAFILAVALLPTLAGFRRRRF